MSHSTSLYQLFLAACAASLFISSGPCVRAVEGGVPEGWFVWPAVEPADGSALDTSELNHGPAGEHGRVTTRDGIFLDGAGARIRFWGANISSYEAFPSAEDVELIARRLAKGGVNIARLHHLDNSWGIGKGGSLWAADRGRHDQFDPASLDALHRLVAVLKRHGIYSNVNLKVSKQLVPADGFAETVSQLPGFQKRVDFYQRRMIELQKDYARQLLTAVNPHTGLSLIDDPAVAVIEINNENSLLGYWTRDLGRGLDAFPEPFRGELAALWNTWLARRYPTDAALRSAWQEAGAVDQGSLVVDGATWRLKKQPGTSAAIVPGAEARAVEFAIEKASGIPWHAQASLGGFALADSRVYTVAFEARADRVRTLQVGVGLDGQARPEDEWRSFGMLETVSIGTEWAPVQLVFPAHSVMGDLAALSFNVSAETGTVSIRALRMVAGCEGAGLREGQSPREGSVPIPGTASSAQWADWIHFLADTERAFADEMRAFLKGELHAQAPIACSQIDYGGLVGLWREQAMDFADGHAYWQHPDFPGGADWDAARWTIKNSPQLAEFSERSFAGFGSLAFARVAGKPFSVSEYDHPAPSDFVSEMYPTLATFACRQDWDALYPFALASYGSRNAEGRMDGFFDQVDHPAKWAFAPFATRVFRRELIAPAGPTATLRLATPVWAEQPHADLLWRRLLPKGPINFLNLRLRVSDRPEADDACARVSIHGEPDEGAVKIVRGPHGSIYTVSAMSAVAAVGYIGDAESDLGPLRVVCAPFGRGFAAVTAVALDENDLRASRRVLITVAARGENVGMTWNEARTSVGSGWGRGPTMAERVPATFTLAGNQPRIVYALAPDGTRARRIAATVVDGGLQFSVGPDDNTLHYEVVAE